MNFVFTYPLKANVAILNGLTHEFKILPGQSSEGKIIIKNFGDKIETIKLYKTDYLFNAEGKKFYPSPGNNERSNAAWITFSPSQLDLAPQATAEITFKISVPLDDSLKGTFWSLIMVEPMPIPLAYSFRGKQNQPFLGINQVVRYGIQIIIHIGESGEKKLQILHFRLINESGKHVLQLDIENIGERGLVPELRVELFNSKGEPAGKFSAGKLRIYPQCSVRYEVDLGQLPEDNYSGLILLDTQDDQIFAYRLNLDLSSQPKATSSSKKAILRK